MCLKEPIKPTHPFHLQLGVEGQKPCRASIPKKVCWKAATPRKRCSNLSSAPISLDPKLSFTFLYFLFSNGFRNKLPSLKLTAKAPENGPGPFKERIFLPIIHFQVHFHAVTFRHRLPSSESVDFGCPPRFVEFCQLSLQVRQLRFLALSGLTCLHQGLSMGGA